VLAVPILTMKSMAEERRSKTDQMFLTYPVTVTRVVLGKFFAMLTVFAVPLIIACLCPLIIMSGNVNVLLIDYSAIFAFLCLGALFVSIGMFISSLTESQIIAAVGSMGAILALCLWSTVIELIPIIPLRKALSALSIGDALSSFTNNYVFDIRAILLFLSGAVLFVVLTVFSVQKRRLN
jgi:ABC-2 type transport system permease protein